MTRLELLRRRLGLDGFKPFDRRSPAPLPSFKVRDGATSAVRTEEGICIHE
ncbi:hypothetical protein [Sphingomonas oryzagri]